MQAGVISKLVLLAFCQVFFVNGTVSAQSQHDSDVLAPGPRDDLLSSIESAIALGRSYEPFHVLIEYNASDEYGGEIVATSLTRIRFIKSADHEALVFATESRSTDLVSEATQLFLNATTIEGKKVVRKISGQSAPTTSYASSFESAVESTMLPCPEYWGIFKYPTLSNSVGKRVLTLRDRIHTESNSVTSTRSDNSITYTLNVDRGPNDIDTLTWRFRLPELSTEYIRLDRKLSGPRHMVLEESLIWETIGEKRVPVQLFGSIGIVRMVEGKEKPQVGTRHYDVRIVWLTFDEDAPMPTFPSVSDIKKYVDDGFVSAEASH